MSIPSLFNPDGLTAISKESLIFTKFSKVFVGWFVRKMYFENGAEKKLTLAPLP